MVCPDGNDYETLGDYVGHLINVARAEDVKIHDIWEAPRKVVFDCADMPFRVPMVWWGRGFWTPDWEKLAKRDWSTDDTWSNPAPMTDQAYDEHIAEWQTRKGEV